MLNSGAGIYTRVRLLDSGDYDLDHCPLLHLFIRVCLQTWALTEITSSFLEMGTLKCVLPGTSNTGNLSYLYFFLLSKYLNTSELNLNIDSPLRQYLADFSFSF